jgi:alpha-tubulin suppressor-like RCC1 family protein
MPFGLRKFLYSSGFLLVLALPARAATVNATWNTATDVAVSASSYTATGNTANFTLNFAPATGANLMVVNNTGLPFISGTFDNLVQGQAVVLTYNGSAYSFVANYYGGTGNDLMLVWANNRAFAWGGNILGRVGDGTTTQRNLMVPVTASGVLAGKTIVALAESGTHSLALCSDGTLAAWGYNGSGQLGNNTTTDSTVPVLVNTASAVSALYGKTVVAVAAATNYSMALCSDGTVATWGINFYGTLGNNSTTGRMVPVAVNVASGVSALYEKSVVAIAAGDNHCMAQCSDGTLVTWGYNLYGQLGNNSNTTSKVPVLVNTVNGTSALYGKTVVSIAAGANYSMALSADGTVTTWGYNSKGQLGNNSTTNSKVPLPVNSTNGVSALYGKNVVAVAAGDSYGLALCADNTVLSWGDNASGQLGNNTTTQSTVPVLVNMASGTSVLYGKTVLAITVGGNTRSSSRAFCADGTLATWGNNAAGNLGNNSVTNSSVPVAVIISPLTVAERAVNPSSSINAAQSMVLVAEPPPTLATLAASAITSSSAAVSGTVNANSGNASVSFDYGTTTTYGSNVAATPVTVSGGTSTAVNATLAGLLPNTTYHFRVNVAGYSGGDQTLVTLNNDATLSSLAPSSGILSPAFSPGTTNYTVNVSSATSSITLLPALADVNATVTVNGAAAASGSVSNAINLVYGNNVISCVVTAQDGTTAKSYSIAVVRGIPDAFPVTYSSAGDVPVSIKGLIATGGAVNFTLNYAVAAGTNLMVVNNTGPGFIDGTFSNLSQGQTVLLSYNGSTYSFVANYYGGTGNDLVLVWSDHRIFSWGPNSFGTVGDGTTTTRSVMVPVMVNQALAGKTIFALAEGYYHKLALCSDGTVLAWGGNGSGQLGTNNYTDSSVPVRVNTASGVSALYGKTVVAISAGFAFSMALCSDGTVATWGGGTYGVLGNNSTAGSSVPVAVNTTSGVSALYGKSVVAISAGGYHCLALCSDGTVAAWGWNGYGQFGNTSLVPDSSVPVMMNTANGPAALVGRRVVALSASQNRSLLLCSDGVLADPGLIVSTASGVSALYGKTVASIASGLDVSMALCTDGTVAAWGDNGSGQLGNNSTTSSGVPVAVNTASGVSALNGKTVVGVAFNGVDGSSARALCSDGTLASWGAGGGGNLGNNTSTDSKVPVTVITSPLTVVERVVNPASSTNTAQSMILVAEPPPTVLTLAASAVGGTTATLNGTVNANNGNAVVLFDYGTTTAYGSTVATTPGTVTGNSATAVSAALSGLTPNTTYHFRVNVAGYSGADQTFTTPNNDPRLFSLASSAGALGTSFSTGTLSYAIPMVDASTTSVTVMPTLNDANASVNINGVTVASGSPNVVNLAYGTNVLRIKGLAEDGVTSLIYYLAVPRALPSTVSASYSSASTVPLAADGLTATGTAVNFTLNFAPVVGTSLTVVNNTGADFINGTFSNLAQGQTVLLSYNGIGYSYVANYYGGTGNDLVLVWAGSRAMGWGLNSNGELGDSSQTNRQVPVPVTSTGVLAGKTIVALAAGYMHSLALCSDGTLAAWGANLYGEVGDNTTIQRSTPVAVNTASGVSALYGKTVVTISAGYYLSVALCSDGTVVTWGVNTNGGLGDATTISRLVPVAVNTSSGVSALYGKKVTAISAGKYHVVALCSDGSVVAWGYNANGMLGNNTLTSSSVPVMVNTAAGVSALYDRRPVAVAAGGSHCLALCSDGTVAAWGLNTYGGLGDNTTTQRTVPVAVSTASGVSALNGKAPVALAAGLYHSLVLCADGSLTAWGYNTYGQIGDNSTTNRLAPVLVNTSVASVLNGRAVVALASGAYQSAVQCSDGTVAVWGYNTNGQLGTNTTTNSSLPLAVTSSGLATGEKWECLGGGSYAYHLFALAAAPPAAPVVTSLAATAIATTSVTLNGTVNASNSSTAVSFDYGTSVAYGPNAAATPGTLTADSATAVATSLTGLTPGTTYHFRVKGVSGAGTSNGSDLTFTTLNYDANLSGLSTSSGTLSPAFTMSGNNYVMAVSTDTTSITVTPTASDSNATLRVNGTPVTSGSASSPISLSYGENTITVLITATDTVTTWTYTLTVTRPTPPTWPIAFASASDVPMTANGYSASGAVDFSLTYAPAPGTTLTVVNNTSLGFISGAFSNLAQGQIVPLIYDGVTYKFVANYYGGTGNDLVLTWAGTRLVAWGDNRNGQLGTNSSYLLLITPLNSLTPLAVTAGNGYSLALFSGGTLASWGVNLGPTGVNTTYTSDPMALSTAGTHLAGRMVVAASAGGYHALALCSDGSLASWGDNSMGQLGNFTSGYSQVPVAVTTAGTPLAGKSVVLASAGLVHSLALCSDGTLVAWGSNSNSQLGDPTVTDSSFTPVAVKTAGTPLAGKTVMSVSAGGFHSLALCSDGTLVSWGQNASGQLGNNSTTTSSVPVAVTTAGTPMEGKTVIAISAGLSHSLALCSDGTLVAWGDNSYGALGNNSLTASSVPVAVNTSGVLAGKTVIGVTAGQYASLAWCSDGTALAWGRNDVGQLGNSSAGYSISVPVMVSAPALATGEKFTQVASSSSSQHALGLVATTSPDGTSSNAAASLSGLSLSRGTLNTPFASDTSFYLVVLDSTVTSIAITPTATSSHASITVNGQAVASGAASSAITLVPGVGANWIPVTVTAENGTQVQYSVVVACLNNLEQWRFQAFGLPVNTGITADTADYDGDGIPNLVEYALNLSPKAASKLPVGTAMNGANYEYTYTRSTAAVNAGTGFTVQWSSTLAAGSWSSSGVVQTVLSDDGTTQQVKAVIPMNAASCMFVHLSVTAP